MNDVSKETEEKERQAYRQLVRRPGKNTFAKQTQRSVWLKGKDEACKKRSSNHRPCVSGTSVILGTLDRVLKGCKYEMI